MPYKDPEKKRKRERRRYAANPERAAFNGARRRCTSPRDKDWYHYGGRGIEFRLESDAQLIAAIGPRPAGMTLDRINNDGPYEIGNIRWATRLEQRANQRPRKSRSQI